MRAARGAGGVTATPPPTHAVHFIVRPLPLQQRGPAPRVPGAGRHPAHGLVHRGGDDQAALRHVGGDHGERGAAHRGEPHPGGGAIREEGDEPGLGRGDGVAADGAGEGEVDWGWGGGWVREETNTWRWEAVAGTTPEGEGGCAKRARAKCAERRVHTRRQTGVGRARGTQVVDVPGYGARAVFRAISRLFERVLGKVKTRVTIATLTATGHGC